MVPRAFRASACRQPTPTDDQHPEFDIETHKATRNNHACDFSRRFQTLVLSESGQQLSDQLRHLSSADENRYDNLEARCHTLFLMLDSCATRSYTAKQALVVLVNLCQSSPTNKNSPVHQQAKPSLDRIQCFCNCYFRVGQFLAWQLCATCGHWARPN